MLFARLEHDQTVAAREGVRRAGHRLDGDAPPPLGIGESVAGEDHQVWVALVDPERGPVELDAGQTILFSLEVGEAVVETHAADRVRCTEVELSVDRRRAHWNPALVALEDGPGREPEYGLVDVGDGEIRMGARPVRA